MILPCRIHRTRKIIDSLSVAFLFAVFLMVPVTEAMAQYGAGSSEGTGAGGGRSVPLEITAGVDIGYDDHVLGSNAATSSSSPSSFFARENLVLSYDRPGKQTEFRLLAIGRFTQFFDVGTDDKDVSVTASLTHNFTTRLSFRADIYGAYQTEPNFQSNVGPENVRAPHFDTNDIFSLTYHWLPRLSTVTSYTFERIKYERSTTTTTAVGLAQDRFQNTLAERLQFSLTSRTNLVVEYRYLIVDYDTAPRDSTTHFALAGFDHHLTEHLLINVLGGESFRSFKDDGNTINPYAEVKVGYQGSNNSLTWITTYGVEQPTQTLAMGTTAIRTGLNATHDLTSRIKATAGLHYHHNQNQGQSVTGSAGSQDALQLTLGLKYPINKHFVLHVDYEYSAQSSAGGIAGYSRNRYFGGLTYTY
jgi:opacity protein-like surface antigen